MKFKFRNLSNDSKLLFYFFIIVFIIWIIFDTIKYNWADDPFQKIVLAPLGEESFKLLVSIILVFDLFMLLWLFSRKFHEKIKFEDFFCYALIPFGIVVAFWFGLLEGPIKNIILHVSTTTIAAILVITIFKKIKDKNWKTRWKVVALSCSLILPMFIHSIQNQYSNITYANNHPEFDYLVVIGRFLENNTFLDNQGVFSLFIFSVTYVLLCIFMFSWILKNKKKRAAKNDL